MTQLSDRRSTVCAGSLKLAKPPQLRFWWLVQVWGRADQG